MKNAARVFFFTLAFAMAFLVSGASGQSASGGFHAVTDEGTRNIEFNAKINPDGSTSGNLKLTAPLTIPDQDVDGDGTGDPGTAGTSSVSMRVDVDCLRVEGNRAVVGGVIKESSANAYVGRRMLLTVEDGGEGANANPDRYTWGQYRSTAPTWVASDAELEFDSGVGLTWIASDFERTDDVGVPSGRSNVVDCKSFSLSSYALEDLAPGSGNIQVRP